MAPMKVQPIAIDIDSKKVKDTGGNSSGGGGSERVSAKVALEKVVRLRLAVTEKQPHKFCRI